MNLTFHQKQNLLLKILFSLTKNTNLTNVFLTKIKKKSSNLAIAKWSHFEESKKNNKACFTNLANCVTTHLLHFRSGPANVLWIVKTEKKGRANELLQKKFKVQFLQPWVVYSSFHHCCCRGTTRLQVELAPVSFPSFVTQQPPPPPFCKSQPRRTTKAEWKFLEPGELWKYTSSGSCFHIWSGGLALLRAHRQSYTPPQSKTVEV